MEIQSQWYKTNKNYYESESSIKIEMMINIIVGIKRETNIKITTAINTASKWNGHKSKSIEIMIKWNESTNGK